MNKVPIVDASDSDRRLMSGLLIKADYEPIAVDTMEQRYRQLLGHYPRLFDVVSLGEIATCLNISRRQLHRIRETIAAENAKEEKSNK